MKTAIALFLTDTHLAENNIEVVKSVFRQAIDEAKRLGFDTIYHLGDIFHSRRGQIVVNLNSFLEILDMLHQEGIKLVLIPGNHDKQQYSAIESFLDTYQHHPALKLTTMFSEHQLAEGISLSMLPFFEDEKYIFMYQEMLDHEASNGVKRVLGTHIGCSGAKMNSGTIVESTITTSLFKNFDLVLIGHYHDPQELGGGKVKYVGSSLQHNFGETEHKGATILYDDLSIETCAFQFPKYLTFEVDVNAINLKDIADIKVEKEQTGNFIRIVLKGKEADIKSFNRAELLAAGIKVEMKEDRIEKKELESRIEPFDASSLAHEFDTFCEKNKLDKEFGKKYFSKVIA